MPFRSKFNNLAGGGTPPKFHNHSARNWPRSDRIAWDAYCRASRIPQRAPPPAAPGSFEAELRARAASVMQRLPKPRLRPDRCDAPPREVYADPALVGLWYATAAQSAAEEALALALYDTLTDMAPGHGLSLATACRLGRWRRMTMGGS